MHEENIFYVVFEYLSKSCWARICKPFQQPKNPFSLGSLNVYK